jgi:predicted deacylase
MRLFLLLFLFYSNAWSSSQVNEGFWIKDNSKVIFESVKNRPELTIDHVSQEGFELYGPIGLEKFLIANHVSYSNLNEVSTNQTNSQGYPTPEEIELDLQSLAKKYPQLMKLYSIGKSSRKRDLWAVKLSRNASVDDDRPEFKYIANMHGDEIVGRELMLRFIKDCLEHYTTDKSIQNLLDQYQIHILVSMNPDGAKNMSRGNADGIDLNRDFPDFSTKDNQDTIDKRAPETQAVMKWQAQHHFRLSANFHGGAEVVNYPWDAISDPSPQDILVKDLSLEYSQNASYIGASTVFENGITNGFAWYKVNGGMQDWSIYWRKDLQLTIELSKNKWPKYSMIDYYYQQNRMALIHFIERINTI